MSLHVIIGFDARGASGKPSLVYVGRSAQEAKDAKALDTSSVCFEEFHNVNGLRKNNPNFKAVVAEAVVAAEVDTVALETEAGASRKKGK